MAREDRWAIPMRCMTVAAVALLGACEQAQPAKLKNVAHVTQPVSVASKQPGEQCAAEGASVCVSPDGHNVPLCIHYGPGLDAQGNDPRYVCSSTCDTTADCREEFECVQLQAGEGNRVCLPHVGFVPHAVAVRAPQPEPSTAAVAPMLGHIDAPAGAMMPAGGGSDGGVM